MLDIKDFSQKQIIVVRFKEGEKISFKNDNIIVTNKENKIIHQSTCYQLFSVWCIGNTTITSVFFEKSKKFFFSIVLFTNSFRLISIIGGKHEGNLLLRKKQYNFNSLTLAKQLIENKIINQISLIESLRNINLKKDINSMKECINKLKDVCELNQLMAYEGIASKLFFKNYFDYEEWKGRKPRTKIDWINSLLDIGYTVLFNFIETLLNIYGFDLYVGIMHKEFYMRKSLVCDMVESFRSIIDKCVRKNINLKKFKNEDFLFLNGQYKISFEKITKYIGTFLESLLERKEDIFKYIRTYYRNFMNNLDKMPFFEV